MLDLFSAVPPLPGKRPSSTGKPWCVTSENSEGQSTSGIRDFKPSYPGLWARWSSALEPALGVFHGVSAGGCLVLASFYFEDVLSPSCIRNSICGSGVFLSSGPASFYVTFSINGMKMEKAKETEKV